MQLFYLKNINSDFLEGSEYNHCTNALRNKKGDVIYLTDGEGNLYNAKIFDIYDQKVYLKQMKKIKSYKYPKSTSVAVAPPKNINRVEWMVEKLTEIGIEKIYFIKSSNSIRKKINFERLEKKVISAMKQCNSLFKTKLKGFYSTNEFLKKYDFENKFLADINSKNLKFGKIREGNSVILIGPEGDFSKNEIMSFLDNQYKRISLGNMILRSETAAVVGGFLINNSIQK